MKESRRIKELEFDCRFYKIIIAITLAMIIGMGWKIDRLTNQLQQAYAKTAIVQGGD